jgi:hypothetical protein
VDAPTGNINYSEAQRIAKSPFVEKSIPLAYGDNFKSYRIVGTTHDYVDHYDAKLESGSLWSGEFEATIGSKVAHPSSHNHMRVCVHRSLRIVRLQESSIADHDPRLRIGEVDLI